MYQIPHRGSHPPTSLLVGAHSSPSLMMENDRPRRVESPYKKVSHTFKPVIFSPKQHIHNFKNTEQRFTRNIRDQIERQSNNANEVSLEEAKELYNEWIYGNMG